MSKSILIRLGLWGAASLVLAGLTTFQSCPGLIPLLSYDHIVSEHNVAPWGVLGLCLLWLYLKRKDVLKGMRGGAPVIFLIAGMGIIGLSLTIPVTPDILLLKIIVLFLGLFALFFGRGALTPMIIFSTYAFTIIFPVLVQAYLEQPYALTSVIPVTWLIDIAGLPITVSGQVFSFSTPPGKEIAVLVAGACAGPATMAVFISIFILMLLDLPLPGNRAFPLFIFGVFGTWLQNVLRIALILACGYFISEEALWNAHFWTTYVLFPLWYLIFAAVYFKVAIHRSQPEGSEPQGGH